MAEEGRDTPPQVLGGNAQQELKSFAERIQRLREEKKAITDDIKTVKDEAKAVGFDPKALDAIVKEMEMDAAEKARKAEFEAVLDTYRHAMGLLADLPLGAAAAEAAAREAMKNKHGRGAASH